MDTGLSIRSSNVTTPTANVRLDVPAVREAVTTELSPAQSVTAAPKAPEVRADETVRKVILDAQSREVIYQVLDVGSGRVVRQIPEEATLRLRAYVRALNSGATPNQAQMQADLDVEV